MPENPATARPIAVIGGGITGLAAAHRLTELDPRRPIALFEAGDRLGGSLHTEAADGFLLEAGADNFITNVPWAIDLCRRIGFAEQLVETNPEFRRALIVRGGRLYPVPEGFMLMEPRRLWPVLASPLLSVRGRLRLLGEYFVAARRDAGDESLASFARRRLGREAFERLVQPLAAGIYTADPERLSLAATLPRFIEMEQMHGGLIRAVRRTRHAADGAESGARYSLFVAPRDGMGALPAALTARLPPGSIRLRTPVTRLARAAAGGWLVSTENAAEPLACAAVIVATAAPHAAQLVGGFDAELAAALRQIEYASTAVVIVGYRAEQIGRPLDGFGFVVPEIESRRLLSASFSSVKFAGRAPAGHVLLRAFLGGAKQPELVELADRDLLRIVGEELGDLLGVRGAPGLVRVARWRAAMPQYHLGHVDLVARIEAGVARWPGLELAGNAYHGVGIPHCIHSGETAAQRVAAGWHGAAAAARST